MSDIMKPRKTDLQPISVFIRVRPVTKEEQDARSSICVEITDTKNIIIRPHGRQYTFDRVFGPNSKQVDIYQHIVKPLIPEVLAGYNCTIFAYGQTGTGKTHTMAGNIIEPEIVSYNADAGIIPRAITHLFDEVSNSSYKYSIHVSYLEVYNEELFDLLSDNVDNKNIRLFDQRGSVVISGICTETVTSKDQVYSILQKGKKRRFSTAYLSECSSRSHEVFTITVHTSNITGDSLLVKMGKLNLVDLAGSENIAKSKLGSRRCRETGNINQSLLTLGRVIKSLAERSVHIPYRESKLTRILRDSLGGNTKTYIIGTISPAACNLEETLSTLDYAYRAKYITNKPEINEQFLSKLSTEDYEKEMARLRKDLYAARTGTGIYVDQDNYEKLVYDNQISKKALSEKDAFISDLEGQFRRLEKEKDVKELEYNKIQASFHKMTKRLVKFYTMFMPKEQQSKELLVSNGESGEVCQNQAMCFLEMIEEAAKSFYKKFQALLLLNETSNNSVKSVCQETLINSQSIINQFINFIEEIKQSNEYVTTLVTNQNTLQKQLFKISNDWSNSIVSKANNVICVTSKSLESAINNDLRQKMEFLENLEMKFKEALDVSRWGEAKTCLENTGRELLTELNKAKESVCSQRKVTNVLINEIEIRLEVAVKYAKAVNVKTISKSGVDIKNFNIDASVFMAKLTIGKGMLQIQHGIKSMAEHLLGLENTVRIMTNNDYECIHDLNKTRSRLECGLTVICDKIQKNIDYKSSAISEVMDSIDKNRTQETAVNQLLKQFRTWEKRLPSLPNQLEIQVPDSVEACVENLLDVVEAHIENNNHMYSQYITDSSAIEKHLRDINASIAQNKILIHSTMEGCQNSLLNFLNNGIVDLKSRDSVSIVMESKQSNSTQTMEDQLKGNSLLPRSARLKYTISSLSAH